MAIMILLAMLSKVFGSISGVILLQYLSHNDVEPHASACAALRGSVRNNNPYHATI